MKISAAFYDRMARWAEAHPLATRLILGLSRALVPVCIGLYALLLVLACLTRRSFLLRALLVPAISFLLVTGFRRLVNRRRPYEAFGYEPISGKRKNGQSFPSRHTFSIFVIAMTWLFFCRPVGLLLLAAGAFLGFSRVFSGVHYPSDVIAGAAIGILTGVIGYVLI